MMRRLLLAVMLLFAWAGPAHADDISASARGVVRIVTIAVVDDEVVGFGHGSGFAVGPNRVVTNAHVVELAGRYPDNVVIGVVPSEGDKSYQGKVIKIDQARDLALIEFTGVRLPPLTLFGGKIADGDTLVALGYPGNVDVATARSAADFIKPQSPVRSQGGFAGFRQLSGVNVLVHNASIARGNSGGPLLDRCGRVLGVNSAITHNDEGDSTFAFAIAGSELAAFLAEAKQPVVTVDVPCTSVEEQMAQERTADEKARLEADEVSRAAAAKAAAEREDTVAQARSRAATSRENYMAGAVLLLVLGALTVGGGGLLLSRERKREGIWVAAGGGVVMLAAIVMFLTRPSFNEASVLAVPKAVAADGSPVVETRGKLVCTLVPERSRVIVSATDKVDLDVGKDGCINGRTQYAESGTHWQRILVPDQEANVSVLDFDPATGTYTNTRYLLSSDQMKQARALRKVVPLKECSSDQAKRAELATQQQNIRSALPSVYNEKLVYKCAAAGADAAASATPAGK